MLVYCLFDTKKMSSWQRDTAGRTALSTSPSPSPSSLNRLFMGGIGRVWLSGAERCERLPFLLSPLLYTEGGEGYDTRTHPPNHTHKHFFFSLLLSTHTHTTTCAPVLLTSSMQCKQMRHPCMLSAAHNPVSVCCMTRVR